MANTINQEYIIHDTLSGSQRHLFRDAVVHRCAGLATKVLAPGVISEGTTEIGSDTYSENNWEIIQAQLFQIADELIDRILDLFSIEAYNPPPEIVIDGV